MNRPLMFLGALAMISGALAAVTSACSSSGDTTPPALDNEGGAGDGGGGGDASSASDICERTRAYVTACNALDPDAGDPLNCGADKFDSWCAANDLAVNSDAYRHAEETCLTTANCGGNTRADCEAKSYVTSTPTAAQKAVVLAYCQTCEPSDSAGCVGRKAAYNAAAGPDSTDDVFIAAWELNDTLVGKIQTQCTGASLDAGASADPATCEKAFGFCAGGIYLDAVPNCP